MDEKLEPIVDKYVRDLERMLPHVLNRPIITRQKQKEKKNRKTIRTFSCTLVKVSCINKNNKKIYILNFLFGEGSYKIRKGNF